MDDSVAAHRAGQIDIEISVARGAEVRTSRTTVSTQSDEKSSLTALPAFTLAQSPNFIWPQSSSQFIPGEEFCRRIDNAYSVMLTWRRNIFLLPSGSHGKDFVAEQARLFDAFGNATTLECVALKAALVMPALLLQKPSATSKTKNNNEHLGRRLTLWREGRISELVAEVNTIQSHLVARLRADDTVEAGNRLASRFDKLISNGRVRAAIRLLSQDGSGMPLDMDAIIPETDHAPSQRVRDVLKEKHPPGRSVELHAVLPREESDLTPHPVLFEGLDADAIRRAALRTEGAAGLSGIDAAGWRRMCCSFGRASSDLCGALALTARRICSDLLDPSLLDAYTANRLIPLDKCPGVRPIGVSKVVRRIIGKAIMRILNPIVAECTGSVQLCAGLQAGCETGVHALRSLFDEPTTEGVLLVDASNAFNTLNRHLTLLNAQVVCPPMARLLLNTYRQPSRLVTPSGEMLLSREGTTQGDPVAMAMYAIGVAPLIWRLEAPGTQQIWFADDSAAGTRLIALRRWWDLLRDIGPAYGYYPNSVKTWLVVKPSHFNTAQKIFGDLEVQISTKGRPYLGGAIGSRDFVSQFVKQKVEGWVDEIRCLTRISSTQPHAAFTAFTHGVSAKWIYMSRVVPNIGELLQPVEDAVRHHLLPALTGRHSFSEVERKLFALPARLGGLGICNAVSEADLAHQASLKVSEPLCALVALQKTGLENTAEEQQKVKTILRKEKRARDAAQQVDLLTHLPESSRRAVELATEKGASAWLTALPLVELGFHLNKSEFRDGLCLRYNWPLPYLPSHCVCGKALSVDHALSCAVGGLPSQRHNHVRDFIATLLTEVAWNVGVEPPLLPLTGELLRYRSSNTEDRARLDIEAYGFWGTAQERALFDIRVFNPFARSNEQSTLSATYRKHELAKVREYEGRVREVERASFTPLVLAATGGMAPRATVFFKRLCDLLAEKRGDNYSKTITYARAKITFCLLRDAIACLRGARSAKGRFGHFASSVGVAVAESRVQM